MKTEKTFHFAPSGTIIKTNTGYTLSSLGVRVRVKHDDVVRLWNDATGEQMLLADFLAGKTFKEFDAVKIFGTDKPAGDKISAWLKSLWGTSEVYAAMSWVKWSVPLDVLLGFGCPLPGVTSDAQTGWHWSCSMWSVKSPSLFESRKAFEKYVKSRR